MSVVLGEGVLRWWGVGSVGQSRQGRRAVEAAGRGGDISRARLQQRQAGRLTEGVLGPGVALTMAVLEAVVMLVVVVVVPTSIVDTTDIFYRRDPMDMAACSMPATIEPYVQQCTLRFARNQ